MSNTPTIACPKCGLDVPFGIATCPEDGTPISDELTPGAFEPTELRSRASGPAIGEGSEPTRKRAGPRPASQTMRRDPLIGQTLGEYVVEELIGVGGMGLVYRGMQPMIGKPVAIKILRPEISDSPTHVERLLAEARAVNAVRHRGIIDIFNFGKLGDGRQYLVMEYLQGKALDEYIFERSAIPPTEAVNLLQEMASALAAAHEAGVVHRDLKPNNIFLVKQSGTHYVKVLDFGLAKQAAPHSTVAQTHAGLVVGTPEYMAPEQARGDAIGPKTDIYSLGVVAFQMLTGQLPFNAKSPMEFLVQHLEYAPPKVIELMPDVPEELSDLVDQMLAKDADDRPTSADQVRRELRRISRLLPQDTTYVGPEQKAPQATPAVPPSGSVIVAPSLSARRSGEKVAPRASGEKLAPRPQKKPETPTAPAQTPMRYPGPTTETTVQATGYGPQAGSGRRRLALLGGAVGLLVVAGAVAAIALRSGETAPVPAAGGAPSVTAPVVSPPPTVANAPPEPAPPVKPPETVTPPPTPVGSPAVATGTEPSGSTQPVASATKPRPPKPATPRVSSRELALNRRIDLLETALGTRPKHPGLVNSARSMLNGARNQVLLARSEAEYLEIAKGLDVWEERFLRPR